MKSFHSTLKLKSAFLLTPLFLIACGPSQLEQSDAELMKDWATYDDPAYSIQYPSEWSLDTSGIMGISMVATSQLTDATDNFRENVNVVTQDMSAQPMDLDTYVQFSEDQILRFFPKAEVLEKSSHTKGATEFRKLSYVATPQTDEFRFEQYYTMQNNIAYVITFSTTSAAFEENQRTGEAILNSFELK